MNFVSLLLFLFLSFNSYSVTKDECIKLYENNSLFCSSKFWDKVAKINRKGVVHRYELHEENRVTGYIWNNTEQERYVYLRWVLHDDDYEVIMSESHTVPILRPDEKYLIDFIFHKKSKVPLEVEGDYLRLMNFEVK